ncbi:phage head closure protein [Phocaeicola dorei]|uniref:phage head closure protein n=1 Tax=Phocaeicola dorei TaxID=357276 RepID=UPI001230A916|nr:phage head closure protein [Phocaeicola dorei]KAA5365073.1 phage head closure protein [Phocaeicola dorei]
MRAGLLTETILLQESVLVKNEFGATSMEWVDYLQTRANIKFNSGNRVNQNNEIFTSYTLTFTIRYYHKVNEQMRIIYQGKKYRDSEKRIIFADDKLTTE